MNVALGTLGKAVGEIQQLFLLSLTLTNHRAMLQEIKESQGLVMAGLWEDMEGKLSSDLMPTNTLGNILQTIVMEGAPLLFSPREENLHLFYEVMQLEVQPMSYVDALMMYLALPLPGI